MQDIEGGNVILQFMETPDCTEETLIAKKGQLIREVRDIGLLCSFHRSLPFLPISSGTNKYGST